VALAKKAATKGQQLPWRAENEHGKKHGGAEEEWLESI
jgi:hypothetical protein